MIRIRIAAIVVVAAVSLAAQTPKPAQPPKTAPIPVHAQGCVASGVEAACLVVKDTGSGIVYNLLIRGARPQVGEGIEFTGVPHDGPTSCMQGVAVNVTQWSRKDSIKCMPDETPDKGQSKP